MKPIPQTALEKLAHEYGTGLASMTLFAGGQPFSDGTLYRYPWHRSHRRAVRCRCPDCGGYGSNRRLLPDGGLLEIPDGTGSDDVVNLYLSGIGVRPEQQSESSLSLRNTLMRLEANLPEKYRPDVEKAKSRFFFDPEIWWRERAEIPHMDTLRRAVWDSVKLRITYHRTSFDRDETGSRIIHPYGLVVKDTEWYLAAFCEKSGEMRTFKCERIQEAERLEGEAFSRPDTFSLETYWRETVIHFKKKVKGQPQKVKPQGE